MFSVDASFAVVILLLMSYMMFTILDSLNSSIDLLQKRQKSASLVVFADELTRREAAVSTNTEIISNKISLAQLDSYFSDYLLLSNQSSYGFGKVTISVVSIAGENIFNRTILFGGDFRDVYCMDRLVVIYETGVPGIMKVCVT